MFFFHRCLGKLSNLTNIFQIGWNHQLGFHWSPKRTNEKQVIFEVLSTQLEGVRFHEENPLQFHPWGLLPCIESPKLVIIMRLELEKDSLGAKEKCHSESGKVVVLEVDVFVKHWT